MQDIPGVDLPPDPGLSGGLGSAPVLPPNTTVPSPNIPGAGLPPMGGAGLGGGVGGGVGGGFGGFGGGGVAGGAGGTDAKAPLAVGLRNPGVTPPGLAPTVSGLPAAGGAASGTGAIPPMMPPMGGMGAGGMGAGSSPGSGAAQRAVTGRGKRRNDGRTPGLPAMLGGRATTHREPEKPDPGRTSDTPTRTTIIDEDLWQVPDNRQTHLGY